jgi:LacI family transcriptional regulator
MRAQTMDKQLKIAVSLNLDLGIMRYNLMYYGIQQYAEEYTNWSLFWDHYPETKLQESKLGSPAYDGIIGRIRHNVYDQIKRLNIPCVNLWYNSKLAPELPSVLTDFRQHGQLAAKHMLSRGFKDLILIHYNDTSAGVFQEGLMDVLKPMKYKVKRYLYNRIASESTTAWKKQMKIFESWVKNWQFPIGIVSPTSLISLPTFCKENGLRVPEEIAILSGTDEKGHCESIKPHLSAIDTDYRRIGYESARMLQQQLKGETLEEKHVLIDSKGVIPRESTDTYATEDKIVRDALRFIADNINTEIQVADVVEQAPISRASLFKRFKAATGSSIKDEIDRLRVISAKRLLEDESIKIKDVYAKAGFSSALHMRRIFNKRTGITPGDFRKSLGAN